MPKCFKCDKEVETAMANVDVWECPCDAVVLSGGFTFGSSLYDAMMDGVQVRIIICDNCLQIGKNQNLIQEFTESIIRKSIRIKS